MFGGKGSKKRRKKNEGNRSTFHGKLVASKLDGTNKRIKHISKRVFILFYDVRVNFTFKLLSFS
jgi:hypothetical protein